MKLQDMVFLYYDNLFNNVLHILCEDDLFILQQKQSDSMRRSRHVTEGGPAPPPLTGTEEALAQSLEGRGVHGIDGGLDTDGKH